MVQFQSSAQEDLFKATVRELQRIGYRDGLVEHDYGFLDYFNDSERVAPAVAFGQSPPSYNTACFGVLLPSSSGTQGQSLVAEYRSLGAPFHFEVYPDRVAWWVVGQGADGIRLPRHFQREELHTAFQLHIKDWSPEAVLRAKNIAFPQRNPQFDFFDFGLIPALEDRIQQKLDPILKSALAASQQSYKRTTGRRPDERDLFRLAFRLLAGKVLHDRRVGDFPSLDVDSGPDAVLQHVADHYGEPFPRILNLHARQAAFNEIWSRLDFRNLSIDVLTFIWSTTLVTAENRDALGIHTTPRAVAKYIVDHLPQESFAHLDDNGGVVVEPCCGSAVFLVEAMQRIRDQLPSNLTPQQRHDRFRRALVGFEQETFGIEIARLCLTLADFPERNRWQLHEENVFKSQTLPLTLRNARVVLCNPPFQDFGTKDPLRNHAESPHKPAEILRRVLLDLHPQGVLGFVLPRKFIDSSWYRDSRRALVARFGNLEIVSLPDIVFRQSESQHETALLIASQPRIGVTASNVRHLRVSKANWPSFAHFHKPTSEDCRLITEDQAAQSVAVPELDELWSYLSRMQKLRKIAMVSRGIEWNVPLTDKNRQETGNREKLVLDKPIPGVTREGVPPGAKISQFEKPSLKHLVISQEKQRGNAYRRPWELPKVILNKARRSRSPWRISAFADLGRLTCYQTFIAVWPNDPALTTALAAVFNGPLANAFFFTGKEGLDTTLDIIKDLPIPVLPESERAKIDLAVSNYLRAVKRSSWEEAKTFLLRIDALVLAAYDLPPRLERRLLDFFSGCGTDRRIPFTFADYFPPEFESNFSLLEYASEDFRLSTAGMFRARRGDVPDHVLDAMRLAVESFQGE